MSYDAPRPVALDVPPPSPRPMNEGHWNRMPTHRMTTKRILRAPRRIAVHLPSPLRSYSHGEARLSVAGATLETLGDVLRALDRRAPGFRFRIVDELGQIRPHVRIYRVAGRPQALASLDATVADGDELFIAATLSGG